MKMFKKAAAFILAAAMLFSLSACGDDGSGAVLRYPIYEEPVCLDPQIAEGTAAKTVVANCFEGLVRYDENGEIVPGVAESWSYDSQSLTYTFKLRQDTEWKVMKKSFAPLLGDDCDETFDNRVTANDFVFAFQRALSPETNSPEASSLYAIKNAKTVHGGSASPSRLGVCADGDYILRITLENSSVSQEGFLALLTQAICMPCNEEFFNATKGRYGLDYSTIICNGPFYLSYWTRESSLTLKANDGYKGNSEVKPASVTFFINSSNEERLTKLLDGTYCAAPLGTVAASESDGLTVSKRYDTVWSLCFNCSDSVLSNAEIRRALCGAIDSNNIVPQSDDLQKTFSIIPSSCIVAGADMSSVPVTILGFDTAKASARWSKALSAAGISTAKLELFCIAEHENAMRRLIQNWQQTFGLSISISISVLEQAELDSRVKSGDYQIALAPISADSSSASDFLLSITSNGTNNVFRLKDSSFDAAVRNLQSLSGDEMLKACRNAEGIFLVSGAALPLFCSPSYFAVAEGVEGLYIDPENSTVSFSAVTRKD